MNEYSINAETCQIEIILTKGNHWPQWNLKNNFEILHEVELEFQKTLTVSINNFDSCTGILLERFGKNDNETIIENGTIIRDQTLAINRMWINDVLLETPILQKNAQFYPEYSESNIKYADEHNIELELVKQDLTLFYNGRWVFNFKQPFFIWYNQILLDEFNNFNHWVRQTHLGIASDQKKMDLEELLAKIS